MKNALLILIPVFVMGSPSTIKEMLENGQVRLENQYVQNTNNTHNTLHRVKQIVIKLRMQEPPFVLQLNLQFGMQPSLVKFLLGHIEQAQYRQYLPTLKRFYQGWEHRLSNLNVSQFIDNKDSFITTLFAKYCLAKDFYITIDFQSQHTDDKISGYFRLKSNQERVLSELSNQARVLSELVTEFLQTSNQERVLSELVTEFLQTSNQERVLSELVTEFLQTYKDIGKSSKVWDHNAKLREKLQGYSLSTRCIDAIINFMNHTAALNELKSCDPYKIMQTWECGRDILDFNFNGQDRTVTVRYTKLSVRSKGKSKTITYTGNIHLETGNFTVQTSSNIKPF